MSRPTPEPEISNLKSQILEDPKSRVPDASHDGASFAETALRLGGKSEEEARRTGAIDQADEQVEALFAAQYQTANSPVHRAVWDRGVPLELFVSQPPRRARAAPDVRCEVMRNSLDVVRRHREAGTLLDQNNKLSQTLLDDLGAAGYWGLLVDREYGGSGRRSPPSPRS